MAFGHCYPPLISNDKLLLIFFQLFVRFFPSFISNTSIVSINFRANLDAQNAANCISGLQISNIFWGSKPPDPPIHAWYVGHTHGLPPLPYPLIYYLTERSLFKKCPPHGKILKRGPVHRYSFSYCIQTFPFLWSVMLAAPRLFLSLIWKFSNVRSFLSPTYQIPKKQRRSVYEWYVAPFQSPD